MPLHDLSGQRFGRLIVVMTVSDDRGRGVCDCHCDCGAQKRVAARSLICGDTKSCGCLARERIAAANMKHGDCVGKPTVEWVTWRAMRQRCEDPNHRAFKDYGGRGIRVCERWTHGDGDRTGFECFLADVGRRPAHDLQIDRYPNNDGNYEPGNVRWATVSEQARNRRKAAPHSPESILRQVETRRRNASAQGRAY